MDHAQNFADAVLHADDIRHAFLTGARDQARRMGQWPCYRCHQSFPHGRQLAGHLLDYHGEAR